MFWLVLWGQPACSVSVEQSLERWCHGKIILVLVVEGKVQNWIYLSVKTCVLLGCIGSTYVKLRELKSDGIVARD